MRLTYHTNDYLEFAIVLAFAGAWVVWSLGVALLVTAVVALLGGARRG